MKNMPYFVAIYSVISCLILFFIDNLFSVTYFFGVIGKLILFLIIPILFGRKYQDLRGKLGHANKSSALYGVTLGILGAAIITVSYFIFKDFIDRSAIHASMETRNINQTTFLMVFVYIMLGNAFLEEYFFRGFVFHNLKKLSKLYAYIFSSLLFSLYHLSIFSTWFEGWIMLLALFGLFLSGLFFAFLYDKTKGIWGAYIFHIFADLSIVILGYFIFFS